MKRYIYLEYYLFLIELFMALLVRHRISLRYCCRPKNLRLFAIGIVVIIVISIIRLTRNKNTASNNEEGSSRHIKRQKEYINRKGMQVIVAHYYDDSASGQAENLTPELVNRNDFSPIPGEGDFGEPVYLPNNLLKRAKTLFQINKFNLMVSDRISLDRILPDVRKPLCRSKKYDINEMLSASIIIVFHNEAWSTLLRTVHSVISSSPRSLIKEIILVDDASDRNFLKKPLDDYVKKLAVAVIIIRMPIRSGLIRSRLKGASVSQGKILLFLDAHCECTKGWLEPLLAPISSNRTRVVSPIIDVISDETFAYIKSFDVHWGAVNWALHFRWFPVGDDVLKQRLSNYTEPFRTPVMAGGLFAIDKSYFIELGQYDPQMDIWGGENIELSLRIWMCGGSLEIASCSRVGHVFRKGSPYEFPGGVGRILYTNLARVAEVWLDEWKEFYYKLNPEAERARHNINVKEREILRKNLNCRSFQWYLKNIWPQHFFPTHSDFFGKIRNKKNQRCLQRPHPTGGSVSSVGKASTYTCIPIPINSQLFIISSRGFIMSDEDVCLDSPDTTTNHPNIIFSGCSHSSHQQWEFKSSERHLIHKKSDLCLGLSEDSTHLSLTKCEDSISQSWELFPFNWAE